jgi:quercetin dioxygenase-like cupin family protein
MIRKGFVIDNPLTHSRVTVLETEVETAGRGWLLEIRSPAHTGPDVPEHFHLTWTETFEILSGTATYRLNHETKRASAGMTIVMPPRQPHVHPWNSGDTELVYRQRNDFGGVDPQAVQDVLGVFATRVGLMRDGLCDERGRPKNPLQLAVTLKTLMKHGGYDASISIPKQNFFAATLGTLGSVLGYEAVQKKYL